MDKYILDVQKLKGEEQGERLDLKESYKWVLNDMTYEDFRAFAVLRFSLPEYDFQYKYMVDEKHDSPKAREDYLKYLMYKLIQNLNTHRVRLKGDENAKV